MTKPIELHHELTKDFMNYIVKEANHVAQQFNVNEPSIEFKITGGKKLAIVPSYTENIIQIAIMEADKKYSTEPL